MAIWKDYISASRLSSFLRRFPNKKLGGLGLGLGLHLQTGLFGLVFLSLH